MRRARLSPGTILPFVAGAAVFAFACGSSSVARLGDVGRPGRWVLLVALLAVSVWWASEGRSLPRAIPGPVIGAVAFALVALASTLWSVDPRLTLERAVTLGLLVVAAVLVGHGAPGRTHRVLAGLVGGGVAVALAGLAVLLVDHGDAVEQGTADLPPRFKGMGESPDTSSLLFALLTGPTLWFALRAPTLRGRLLGAGALALFAGSIVASGSHGAMVAGTAGAAFVAFALPRDSSWRIGGVALVAAACAVGFWVQSLPQPPAHVPAAPSGETPQQQQPAKPGYVNAEINFPRSGELGIPPPGAQLKRHLLTSSGRLQAWGGAVHQAGERPVAGYGFGTESRVFVDRWSRFVGSVPENSYVGLGLQLGVVGLAVFAALVLAVALAGREAVRGPRRGPAIASLGVVAAGLVIGVVQSYFYSVGNIGTLTLWLAFLLVPAAVVRDA